MNSSLVFLACLALALQCSARPQPQVDLSTPATDVSPSSAVSELTDVGTGATEASLSGDQVVFDESQNNQGDADAPGVTTDMPMDDEESQDVVTTVSPCEGEDCAAPSSSVLKIEEMVPAIPGSGDASPAPAGDDSEAMTTQTPSLE